MEGEGRIKLRKKRTGNRLSTDTPNVSNVPRTIKRVLMVILTDVE